MSKKENDDELFFKHFLKDNIVFNNLESRSLSFYKRRYNRLNTVSLFLSFLILTSSSFGHYTIIEKNKAQKTFLTNTLGQTEEYEQTDERKRTIRATIQYQNQRR